MIMRRHIKFISICIFLMTLCIGAGQAYAVACVSIASGNWGTGATWNCGGLNVVPAAGDTVTIMNGHTVTLNVNSAVIASLTVNAGGTLTTAGTSGSDLYIGGNITNNGTMNMQLSTGTNTIYLSGANITSTFSGTGTWLLDNLDLNGTFGSPCTGACKVEISGSPNLQFISATLFTGLGGGFTFNAGNNATATVTLNRNGNQNVPTTGVTYPNLVVAGGAGNDTPAAGTINVLGNLTVNAGSTWLGTTNNPTSNIGGSLIINGTYTASSATTSIGGNFSNNGTFNRGTSTINFNGTSAQTIGGSSATIFNNLTVSNTATGSTTLLSNTSVAGNLSVNSGTLDLSSFTANRTAAGGTITVANGATLMIGGTNGFPTNYTTRTIGATSTIVYSGTNQSVLNLAAPGYGNLTLNGSGTKTAAGSFIVRGDLTISGVTLASGTFTQTVNGNVDNTGTQTASTGSITLSGGASAHTLSGNGNYSNLVLNDALGATLTGSPTVSGVLTMSNGILTTSANSLSVTSNCTTGISGGGATNYIQGNLKLHYPAGTSTCTFPIGSAASYSPATITLVNVTSALANSSLTARTDTPDHADTTANRSGVDAAKSVNRYWTLTPGGSLTFTSYNATFTYIAGNIDGGAVTANFMIARKDSSGIWRYPAMGTKNPTNTTVTGITQADGFGEFVVGERMFPALTISKNVAAISDPVNLLVSPKYIPGAVAEYTTISSNAGGPDDYDSTFITDPIPANTLLFVNDIGGPGPVIFSQGATTSTLTYNQATDLLYSNNGGTFWWAGPPAADADGCDATVPPITHIRIYLRGSFIGSTIVNPNPSFQLKFRVCVK